MLDSVILSEWGELSDDEKAQAICRLRENATAKEQELPLSPHHQSQTVGEGITRQERSYLHRKQDD